jgi:membrane associated rhomboid family serine protease
MRAARVTKSVDVADSKSAAARRASSSLAAGTKKTASAATGPGRMFPIPTVTKNLMLVCVAVFCLHYFGPTAPVQGWLALWPLDSGRFMPWQVLTYAVEHANSMHLFLNMLALWMFGSELERLWGARRYLQFVAVASVAAAAAQLLVTWAMGSLHPTAGASGAVYGLLLAYALTFPNRQFDLVGFLPMLLFLAPSEPLHILGIVLYVMLATNRQAVPIPPVYVRALVMVSIFGGIELFLGLFVHTGIAHFAHLGGMLGGWLMMKFWRSGGGRGSRRR